MKAAFVKQEPGEAETCCRLVFSGVVLVVRFSVHCGRGLGAIPRLSMALAFAGLNGVEALAKPSLLRPSPVLVEVRIKYRPFHDDPRSMHEQSACHARAVIFPTNFKCCRLITLRKLSFPFKIRTLCGENLTTA